MRIRYVDPQVPTGSEPGVTALDDYRDIYRDL